MKKVNLNEEFIFDGYVYCFTDEDGPVKIKRRREAGKGYKIESPTQEECVAFFKSKGFPEKLGSEFYEYYSVADWKDGKGQAVKNYKQKALAVWMKSDRKEQPEKQSSTHNAGGFLF